LRIFEDCEEYLKRNIFGRWDPDLMDGASEEAKISFYGFHKSINEMIHESSIIQHADIGATFLEYVSFIPYKISLVEVD
jgi:hypothetical protein